MAATVEIKDLQSLDAWRRHTRRLTRNSRLPIAVFALPQLGSDRNRSCSILAEEYRTACGCQSAGLFMSVTAVVWAYMRFTGARGTAGFQMLDLAVGAALSASALLIGKMSGLLLARWRLVRLGSAVNHLLDAARNHRAA